MSEDEKVLRELLIVDDEENMLHMLKALLSKEGYSIDTTTSPTQAIALINSKRYDFVLCDVRMPEMDGLSFLNLLKKTKGLPTIIMMSAYGNMDMAISAMKAGAYDFISKPFKKDEVLLTLKKAEERESLQRENQSLRDEIQAVRATHSFASLIWKSNEMSDVVNLASKAAKYDTTVLITGESGTGKELLARGIHVDSPRNKKTFHAINCGSIPLGLLESELFGYMKGAFTGADRNKKGLFEEADGSTLFLDEIGELPLSMQVKLLRVLQENEIRPIGSNVTRKVDVRILTATAKNLEDEVRIGKFRKDLFYRLNVLKIEIPPLRKRIEDIPLLTEHFLRKFNLALNRTVDTIEPSVMEEFYNHNWPGNVRELENVIQRGVVLADKNVIEKKIIPNPVLKEPEKSVGNLFEGVNSIKEARKMLEAKMIKRALEKSGGNKSTAAKSLELSYPSLLNKIKEYDIGNM